MKKLNTLLLCLISYFYVFAQRGRVRPEDLGETDYSSSSSSGSATFYIILLVLMIVGALIFKISLDNSRKKEINEKKLFRTKTSFTAFTTEYGLLQNKNKGFNLEKDFVEYDGKVSIPVFAKCIILEYCKIEHSFVKVKFEKYPDPLYVKRWYLEEA